MNGNNQLPRSGRYPATRQTTCSLALAILLICGTAIGQPAYVIDSLWIGVNAELSGDGETLQIIRTGDEVDVETIADGQARIVTAEGVVGWVDAAYLTKDRPLAAQFRAAELQFEEKDRAISGALDQLKRLESLLQPYVADQTPAGRWLSWIGVGLCTTTGGFFAGIAWRNRRLRKKFGGLLP